MKHCPTCKTDKSLDDFYSDRRTPDGRKAQCKVCHTAGNIRTRNRENARALNAAHMRRARAVDPDRFRSREREASRRRVIDGKVLARRTLNNAVKRGELTRPDSCEDCGEATKVTGHHDDYTKPLSVCWLCYACHGKRHRVVSFRRITP